MLSVIVPVLNEEIGITNFLLPLQDYRQPNLELILVDGGSRDKTIELAEPLCDRIFASQKGRAQQMNVGANQAKGNILLFLHADTQLPNQFNHIIEQSMAESHNVWGRFDVRLSGQNTALRMVEFFMNHRSRWTGIATGDQAVFVKADVFNQIEGYQNISLMEDIALSKALKSISPPVCLKSKVISSSRRWETFGLWRTIFLMWRLRLAYFLGADPNRLAAKYE